MTLSILPVAHKYFSIKRVKDRLVGMESKMKLAREELSRYDPGPSQTAAKLHYTLCVVYTICVFFAYFLHLCLFEKICDASLCKKKRPW